MVEWWVEHLALMLVQVWVEMLALMMALVMDYCLESCLV